MSSESNDAPLDVLADVVAELNRELQAIERRTVVVIAVLLGQSVLAVQLIGAVLIVAGRFPSLTPIDHAGALIWPTVFTFLAMIVALGALLGKNPPPPPSAGSESDWASWRQRRVLQLQTSIHEKSLVLRSAAIATGITALLDSLAVSIFVGALT